MAHTLGSGDVLARGGIRASYTVTEKKITDADWSRMFNDFDPEEFQKKEPVKADGPKEETRTGIRLR
jgi:hypothetical protein